MEKRFNFKPLEDFLTYGTDPRTMSVYLDMLLFEHINLILLLIEKQIDVGEMEIHTETRLLLTELRILRDEMAACAAKEEE